MRRFDPVISKSALAQFEVEINSDQKLGRLIKLGDNPAQAAAKLKRGKLK